MQHTILELYSGIGGMHCAWNESGINGIIAAAVDINTVANEVYRHNFPETKLFTRNIQKLTPKELKSLNINTILMSPPCQPFSRNGKYLDENDRRTDSFLYIISILDQLEDLKYILMENVKGFECSSVRNLFIDKLKYTGFEYQEFLLCPTTIGVPNSRLRYYCIARRGDEEWNFKRKDEIMVRLPKEYGEPWSINNIIESTTTEEFLMPSKLLKRAYILDICYRHSNRSCCITKAYSHYVEGTGSVFTESSPDEVSKVFEQAHKYEAGSEEFVEHIKKLKLRFFSPKEVLSLMSFPEDYSFAKSTTLKQCYRLLGNSVNVKVITELLKILFDQ